MTLCNVSHAVVHLRLYLFHFKICKGPEDSFHHLVLCKILKRSFWQMVPTFGKRLSVYRVHYNTKMSNFGQKNVFTHHWKIFNGTLKPSNGAFKTAHHISGLLMNATPPMIPSNPLTLQPTKKTQTKKHSILRGGYMVLCLVCKLKPIMYVGGKLVESESWWLFNVST